MTKKDIKDNTFILTDSCMWEKNKQEGKKSPHAIQVVDEDTGKTRFIKSGSRIKFVSGEISPEITQEDYNNSTND